MNALRLGKGDSILSKPLWLSTKKVVFLRFTFQTSSTIATLKKGDSVERPDYDAQDRKTSREILFYQSGKVIGATQKNLPTFTFGKV
jgi:hypothetical protein